MDFIHWSPSRMTTKKFRLVKLCYLRPSRCCWLNGPHVEGVAYQWLWFRFEMWLKYNAGYEHMRGYGLARLSPEVVESILKFPPIFKDNSKEDTSTTENKS